MISAFPPTLGRRFRASLVASLFVALAATAPASAATSSDSFLRERAPHEQRVSDLLDTGFVQAVHCREDCLVSGRLTISRRAGSPPRSGAIEVGRFESLQLAGGRWHELTVPLTERGKRLVRRAGGAVQIKAQNAAISLESASSGESTSIETCRRTPQ